MKEYWLQKNTVTYIFIFVILLMLYARNAMGINVAPSIILLVSIVPAFFASESQVIAIVASFLVTGTGFQYKYALLVYLLVGLLRFRHLLKLNQILIPIFLMMFWEILHGFDDEFSMVSFFREFAELLFLAFIVSLHWTKINFRLLSRTFALTVIGISIIIVCMHINSGVGSVVELFSQSASEFRFGQDSTEDGTQFGLNFDANQFGLICNIAIALLLMLISRREHGLLDILLLTACTIIGFTTLSRTYVVVLFFQVVSYMFLSPTSSTQRVRRIVMTLLIIIIIFSFVVEFSPFLYENFMARNQSDDISNGRVFLMEFYHEHIFSSFEFFAWGLGLQGYRGKIAQLYGPNILACHNGIQELWVTWGIMGIVYFAYLLFCMIKSSKMESGNRPVYAFIPLLAFMFDRMAGQLVSSGTAMLYLSVIYIILCLKWDTDRVV